MAAGTRLMAVFRNSGWGAAQAPSAQGSAVGARKRDERLLPGFKKYSFLLD
ncbi:MAG: hypothetical protein AB2598_01140 [Candidatus Thiodiazotropha sp.]